MNGFMSVFKRELRGYFSTPLAYVFLVIFLLLASFMTFRSGFFLVRQASMDSFFAQLPGLMLFLVPAIAMRLWAEEKKSNTLELLFSLPITTGQAVLGKFFAALVIIVLALILTLPSVWTIYYLGSPDSGPVITGYLASLLLAGVYLAVGSFFSALTSNQVIAFVLAVVGCGVLLFAGSPTVMKEFSRLLGAGVAGEMELFSLQAHFESLARGVVEVRDLIFFIVLTVAALFANILLLDNSR